MFASGNYLRKQVFYRGFKISFLFIFIWYSEFCDRVFDFFFIYKNYLDCRIMDDHFAYSWKENCAMSVFCVSLLGVSSGQVRI